jgi:hypothetical protein
LPFRRYYFNKPEEEEMLKVGLMILMLTVNDFPDQNKEEKSVATASFLASFPFVVYSLCGGISLANWGNEEYYGPCFGGITPFSSTFLTIPLHIYADSTLKRYTMTFVPKLLISAGIWGASLGYLGHCLGGCEKDHVLRDYQIVMIAGNILLAGINAYELIDSIHRIRRYNQDIKKSSLSSFYFSFLIHPNGKFPILQFGMRF